jgi:mannose-6-phosphate isomerase
MSHPLYPLRTQPIYRHYIWGGTGLHDLLDKPLGPEGTLAESWEIADEARAENGPYAGKTLREIDAETDGALTGDAPHYPHARLPLLIKLSHAALDLSVQIHPNDAQALQYEPEAGFPGKSEMYLILEADTGAGIYCGLRPGVSIERFAAACKAATGVAELLNFFPVVAGEVLYTPSGVVHALGKGIIYCEVQQNSDITYRLYDWGRLGSDGQPRPLHIEQALRVLDTAPRQSPRVRPLPLQMPAGALMEMRLMQTESGVDSYQISVPPSGERALLCASPHFAVELLDLEGPADLARVRRAMRAVVVLRGHVTLRDEGPEAAHLSAGQSAVVPASLDSAIAEPEGPAQILLAYLPDLRADVVDPLRAQGYADAEIAQLGDVGNLA